MVDSHVSREDKLLEMVSEKSCVLIVGCGPDVELAQRLCNEKHAQVFCLDARNQHLEPYLRIGFTSRQLFCTNLEEPGFSKRVLFDLPHQLFDVIICMVVLSHVKNVEMILDELQCMTRRLIVSHFCGHSLGGINDMLLRSPSGVSFEDSDVNTLAEWNRRISQHHTWVLFHHPIVLQLLQYGHVMVRHHDDNDLQSMTGIYHIFLSVWLERELRKRFQSVSKCLFSINIIKGSSQTMEEIVFDCQKKKSL